MAPPYDYAKAMIISQVTPQITTFSVPFERLGVAKIGGRGTLIKLATGSLVVFSPIKLTPEVKETVQAQGGSLKYIIAPDMEHHMFVGSWSKEYPSAAVIGVEGLPEKREKQAEHKGTHFQHVFSAGNKRDMKISPEFDAEFDYEFFHSHANKELVFLHRPSRTMIQADFMFCLPATQQYSRTGLDARSGIFTKIFGFVWNAQGEMMAQRRFFWYLGGAADRKAFAESSRKIYGWNYDRVIPCHGDIIETGGKAKVDKLTQWFRDMK